MAGARHPDEGAAGQRHPHRLALAAIDAVVAESAAIDALRRDPRPAVLARAIAIDEWRDDEVALRDASDLGTNLFYNASELVAGCTEPVGRLAAAGRAVP